MAKAESLPNQPVDVITIDGVEYSVGDKIIIRDDNNNDAEHYARITKTEIAFNSFNDNKPFDTFDFQCLDDPDLDGSGFGDIELYEKAPTEFAFTESTPVRLFDTKDMEKDDWLAARRRGVSGTDMAAIMGHSKWRTGLDVYMDKNPNYPQSEVEDNMHMWLGRELEDVVAKKFMEETGLKLINQYAVLQHPEYDWMIANIDRKVVGEKAIAELKIANAMFTKKEWGESGTDRVPMNYLIQVYHYMIVCGVRTGYLGVIFTDTREFRWYKFELNEALAARMIETSYDFWFENVCQDNPPEPMNDDDLASLYPVDTLPSVVASDDMVKLCIAHEVNRQEIKRLQEANDELSLQVGMFIGEHRELLVDSTKDVLARFNQAKGRKTCDMKKLEANYPEAFEDCVKVSETKRSVKMNWRKLNSMTQED